MFECILIAAAFVTALLSTFWSRVPVAVSVLLLAIEAAYRCFR